MLDIENFILLFRIDRNAEGVPVDRSGQVTRIDIPNADGTFTTLEGEEAQFWYDRAVAEGERRMAQEAKLESTGTENEIETRGSFYYKYRYLESKHTNDVERTELERIVTNKLRNLSTDKQPYALNLDVSQSWSVSPSVSGSYKDTIKATLGGSLRKTYHKS